MKVKKVKVLMAAILVLVSALSVNFYAFATEEGDDSDFVINEITTEEPTEEKTTSEPTTRPTTTKPTTTRKPTTTSSYRPVYTTGASTTQAIEGFTIKLELNNGEEALEIAVDDNGIVEVPEAPKKEGFKFDGWYSDEALTERWDFITSKATEDTILYAKWASIQDESLFTITVSTNLGGVVTVEPEKAQAGEIVTITVTPDEGSQLVENSLSVNGKFIEDFSFVMPENNVIVEAQFESVDDIVADKENKTDEKSDMGKIITIVAIAVVAVAIIIWLLVNRYRAMAEDEEDELFFVEPMTGQPAIRHDDFIKNKRSELAKAPTVQDVEGLDIINEDEIRKIDKTGTINLNE